MRYYLQLKYLVDNQKTIKKCQKIDENEMLFAELKYLTINTVQVQN